MYSRNCTHAAGQALLVQFGGIEILNLMHHIFGCVAHRRATRSVPIGIATVDVAVDHQIDIVFVHNPCEFAAAQQKELESRLVPEGGHRGRDMRNHDFDIGIKRIKGSIQAGSFATPTDREGLGGAPGNRIRTFVRPESSTRALDTSKANPQIITEHDARTIQQGNTGRLDQFPVAGRTWGATVVIADNGHDRNLNRAEEYCCTLGLDQKAIVRDIARNDQNIGSLSQRLKLFGNGFWHRSPDVEIAEGGYAHWNRTESDTNQPRERRTGEKSILPYHRGATLSHAGGRSLISARSTYTVRCIRCVLKDPSSMSSGRVQRMVWALLLIALVWAPDAARAEAAMAPVPAVSAQAIYVYDATADVVLLAENEQVERAPASTVKIVTAMVVVDTVPLTDQVVVDGQDVTDLSTGESTMMLAAGDTLTVEQLLTGLLLPSGNDAARTLARYVGTALLNGSSDDPIQRFVQAMNEKVQAAGLSHTQFTSPDGFDDSSEMYTTASDLAHLGAMAMGYDQIASIVSQSTAVVTSIGPEAHEMALTNTNKFLPESGSAYADQRVVGLKSGSTTAAGACLVLAMRERGGNLVIAVILGSDLAYDDTTGLIDVDARWDDMTAVLGSVNATFAWLNPESNNDVPGLKDEMAAWQVQLQDDSGLIVPVDLRKSITYRIELKPVGPTQSDAGRVLFFAGADQLAELPLIFR